MASLQVFVRSFELEYSYAVNRRSYIRVKDSLTIASIVLGYGENKRSTILGLVGVGQTTNPDTQHLF